MKQKHVDYLQLEIFSMNIFDTLKSTEVQEKIKLISERMTIDICADHPSTFWNRKKHIKAVGAKVRRPLHSIAVMQMRTTMNLIIILDRCEFNSYCQAEDSQ
ncbi:hypothetical protein H5410_047497, partial [Solanum commersonii]